MEGIAGALSDSSEDGEGDTAMNNNKPARENAEGPGYRGLHEFTLTDSPERVPSLP